MKPCHLCLLICTFLFAAAENCVSQSTMVPWLTRSADNARTAGISKRHTDASFSGIEGNCPGNDHSGVRGCARYGSTAARPANVKLPDGTTHDVMVLPSMANIVRGVDAQHWRRFVECNLGTPINGNTPIGPAEDSADGCVGNFPTIDCHAINDKWGVLSTGVIDPDTQRVYLVSWISPDGTPQNGKHFVFVLNVADGTQVAAPVLVAGTNRRAVL